MAKAVWRHEAKASYYRDCHASLAMTHGVQEALTLYLALPSS